MTAGGAVLHRYLYAFDAALLAGGVYFYLSGDSVSFRDTGEVTVAAAAWVMSVFLLTDVARLRPDQVGDLRTEKSSIEFYLLCVIIYTLLILAFSFFEITTQQNRKSRNDISWVYGSWGDGESCDAPMTISSGDTPDELVVETVDPSSHTTHRYVRKLIGAQTPTRVNTQEGSFLLEKGGTLLTTGEAMNGLRFTRCG